MPESESEDEIIDRIEVALRKIADATAQAPRATHGAVPAELDVSALTQSLDMLIARLRSGLEPARPADHLTE